MDNRAYEYMEPELFASLCAVELPADVPGIKATWTTSQGSGSDLDD